MNVFYIPEPNERQPKPVVITQPPAYINQPKITKRNIYKPIQHRDETYQFDKADIPPSDFAAATHSEFTAYQEYYQRVHQYRPSESLSVSSNCNTSDRDTDQMVDSKIDGMASPSRI